MSKIKQYSRLAKEILIYAYIWQIPFSWRYIIDPNRGFLSGTFNEYMDISLYLGEVFLLVAFCINILEYIIEEKSILGRIKYNYVFHVEHVLIGLLALLLALNIYYSIDPKLSIVSIAHLLGLYVFFKFIRQMYVPRGTKLIKDIFSILAMSIIIQTPIAIFQVIFGTSVGIKALNESILAIDMVNVAKSHIFDWLMLRAYGTFPHPNILAAYILGVYIFIDIFKNRMFHVEHSIIRYVQYIALFLIILTQSKLIILSVLALFLYKYLKNQMFHVEHVVILVVILVSMLLYTPIMQQDVSISLSTRIDQMKYQWEKSTNSILGTGIGTYRLNIDSNERAWWTLEPVHFVPFIFLMELGVLITLVVILLLTKIFLYVPRGTLNKSILPLIFSIFIVSIDHYTWDIYQGMWLIVFMFFIISIVDKNYKV